LLPYQGKGYWIVTMFYGEFINDLFIDFSTLPNASNEDIFLVNFDNPCDETLTYSHTRFIC
jgi:hypothetical protein